MSLDGFQAKHPGKVGYYKDWLLDEMEQRIIRLLFRFCAMQVTCFDSNSKTANQLWLRSFLDQSKGQEMPVQGVCMMLVHNGIGKYKAEAIMTF